MDQSRENLPLPLDKPKIEFGPLRPAAGQLHPAASSILQTELPDYMGRQCQPAREPGIHSAVNHPINTGVAGGNCNSNAGFQHLVTGYIAQ